jgi:hypothetical protein
VKINTNGVFDVASLTEATGAVIRNKNGTFLKTIARQLPSVASVLVAEAEAWRDGLRLIGPSVHQQVILEADSMEMIALWRSRDEQRWEITPILKEIQAMTTSLSSFTTLHIRRTGNVAAHICARHASSIHVAVWENNPPSFLLRQLNDYCNHND